MTIGILNIIPVVPTQRGGQRSGRPPTRGVLLDKMTKAMGCMTPISIAEGKSRPHHPVQAAKFASEGGIVVRSEVPILTSWKLYKEKDNEGFMDSLSVSACLHSCLLSTHILPLRYSDF
jgi:hypothetical protein